MWWTRTMATTVPLKRRHCWAVQVSPVHSSCQACSGYTTKCSCSTVLPTSLGSCCSYCCTTMVRGSYGSTPITAAATTTAAYSMRALFTQTLGGMFTFSSDRN